MIEYEPLQLVKTYFDTATYGDPGGPAWPYRWHHGAPPGLLHPQWGRDCLLHGKVLLVPEEDGRLI